MSDIILKSISFSKLKGRPLEWSVEGLELGHVNLLVGKNSTGKSRVLNIIGHLAKQFQNEKRLANECTYKVVFESSGVQYIYDLCVERGKVVHERVEVDGVEKLIRDNSELKIWATKLGHFIEFEPSDAQVAVVGRRDKLQHPFLLPFRDWAKSVRAYHFGSTLGKDHLAISVGESGKSELDDSDETQVVAIFERATREFGEKFVNLVTEDMNSLGFELKSVGTGRPDDMKFAIMDQHGRNPLEIDSQLRAIGVVENGVRGMIFQNVISQGMFRALSILVQVNYAQLSNRANCILIDDIGEGLDFDRSTSLIKLLREKSTSSQFQLIMATNDQFVMNHVPLAEWSVLCRDGHKVTVKNIHNSKEKFEEFKFIGMSNFSFFEMNFLGEDNGEIGQNE